jgi:adenosylhomocysteine nucleosidase
VSATGIVAALAAEARTLGPVQPVRHRAAGSLAIHTLPDGTLLVISGMGAAAAAQAARALVAAGVQGLLSFGLAGGLDPALGAGTVLLPRAVTDGTGTVHRAYESWRERLAALMRDSSDTHPLVVDGALLSLSEPLSTPLTKSQARGRTGAVAVDMESFAIASVAIEQGVKFAVARVVVDTAADRLPRSILQATDLRGEVNYSQLIGALLRRPPDIVALLRLARRYRVAMRSLRALARAGVGGS